jgi:hypothetical protein
MGARSLETFPLMVHFIVWVLILTAVQKVPSNERMMSPDFKQQYIDD